MFKTILTAFQFLTIIPIRTKSGISEREVYNSTSFFPFVGALQGLFLALLAYLFLKIMPAEIAAAFVLSFYVLITGGFHQDGLSDTFDALSIKSSGDKERDRGKRLLVMKDSTIGPMGVVVIVLSLLLKYLLMKEILQTSDHVEKYSLFFFMPVFSKWAMVTAMYHAKSARKDGIGRTFLEHIGSRQIVFATALLALSFVVWCAFHYLLQDLFQCEIGSFMLFFFIEMIFVCLACLILKRIFTIRFGGLTGDNFGAIHEISEVLFLTVALLWR
jgi:adenosylcobinamide-GDP ribazoletransferase